MPREAVLVQTFVELADTLVADFDAVDLLTTLAERCVEALDVAAAGVMLATDGNLRVTASSSEAMRVVELFELQSQEGPCLDCYRSGQPVLDQDLAAASSRWRHFAPVALQAGFRTVHALPMCLRGTTIGALNLFQVETRTIDPADVLAGQALADVATISILQHRANLEAQTVNAQLAAALESRVVIEQAKGVLAGRTGLTMEQAFGRLRRHARGHNLRLAAVAEHVIDGTLPATALVP